MFTGSILGFTDLGDLNEYEKTVVNEGKEKEELAKSMMVIIVRGRFTQLQFAYAQFPCASVCGYYLYIFWKAVQHLERCELKVLACTCDGLSVNRAFLSYMIRESLYTRFRFHMQKMAAMSFSCHTHHI